MCQLFYLFHNYPYFREYSKMISIDLSKQWVLDADAKAMHQISFPGKLGRDGNATMFFILEDFSRETTRLLWIWFYLTH